MDTKTELVVVQRADVEAVARRLNGFIANLAPSQEAIVGWLLERAGLASALMPMHVRYKPRGAQHLVVGTHAGVIPAEG